MTFDRLGNVTKLPTTIQHWRALRCGPFVWRLHPELAADEPWLRDPTTFLQDDAQLLKPPIPGFDARVVRIPRVGGNFVLKEYRPIKLKDRVKAVLRGSRGMRAADSALLLQRLGIPTVQPVAAGVSKRIRSQSFLVTRELAPTRNLLDYAGQSPECRRFVIRSLGQVMGKLHRCNVIHGDAHQANFVVHACPKPILTLIDVDAVKRVRVVTSASAVRDVKRLLTYTDPGAREMMLFSVAYCRARGHDISPREFVLAMARAYRERTRLAPSHTS